MTRKVLLVIGLMMATVFSVANVTNLNSGTRIYLQTISGYDNPVPTFPHKPKVPMHTPEVYLEEYTLSFSYNNGYTLELVDASMGDEGTIVYTAVIPEDVLTWQLPTDITGDYIIRLIHGNWTFVGEIEL
jgi:hypothetical protein